MFENYKQKYLARGKIIYVPNEGSKRRGSLIVAHINETVSFPKYFYHYSAGGHVSALQEHKQHSLFFKIDIEHFYYSIKRTRVTRALRHCRMAGASTLAKWSTVTNPYGGGAFVLPIGFIQSPHLATVVLMRSPVMLAIERARKEGVTISVYLDDFIGSHDDEAVLQKAYDEIRQACVTCGLVPNAEKLVAPTGALVAFNCHLTKGAANVTADRIAKYHETEHSEVSKESFEIYVNRVSRGNAAVPE
jgi:hypothetical protein